MNRSSSVFQTIKLMLTHSWVNLSVLILLVLAQTIFQNKIKLPESVALMMTIVIAVFLGVYLAGSFLKLKQNYLWKINSSYRMVILMSYLLIVIGFNLIFIYLFLPEATINIKMIMPFCLTIFASQMVLGKNLISKTLIPMIPLLMIKLAMMLWGTHMIEQNYIFYAIIMSTIILIIMMYGYDFGYKFTRVQKANNNSDNNIAYMTAGMSASQMTAMNHLLGIAVSKWIKASKKMIDWVIFMPHTKLGLYIMFYLFFVFSLVFVVNPSLKPFMGTLVLLIFPMVFISMIIEASHLMKQLKSFAHIFTGKNHRQLKNKILMTIDKNMLISSLMFLLCIGTIIYLFDISFDAKNLSISLLAILIITLCVYPLMLCLNWVNMTFSLIIIVFAYVFIIYKVLSWVKSYPDLALKIPYVVSFLIAALVVRILTQGIFWQKPMEVLMKR